MKLEDGIGVKVGGKALQSKADGEVIEPELCGEEEAEGEEESLSEPDRELELEPAASESEDGYSLHNASSSLQLHTVADSIPSSPASSQLWVTLIQANAERKDCHLFEMVVKGAS